VGTPSPSKLIDEVRKMAEASEPQIAKLRPCLVDIGMMLAGGAIDPSVASSLDALKQTKFLPRRSVKGLSSLVKVTDDFAIPDHSSYSQALAKRGILLDFDLHETQTLHSLFKYMDITDRYLSSFVKRTSSIGVTVKDTKLSEQLRSKAYALYW
jgi:hypothetical protein